MDFDWLSLLRALQVVVEAAFAGIRSIAELVGVHFDKLIGLAGFSFGVWRWWYTRERVLHKRLEYIAEQDRRLEQARADVLEAIHRPGPRSLPNHCSLSGRFGASCGCVAGAHCLTSEGSKQVQSAVWTKRSVKSNTGLESQLPR